MPRPEKYKQFAEELIDRIKKGAYNPEQVLPSEQQFSSESNLSRSTVRKALLHLKELNYINSEAGKGYFINSNMVATLPDDNQVGFLFDINFYDLKSNHPASALYARLEERLQPQKKQLIHIKPDTINSEEEFCKAIENFSDNLIIISTRICSRFTNQALLSEFLSTTDKRVVLYDNEPPEKNPWANTIHCDWRLPIHQTIHELTNHNKTNIIYCGYDNTHWSDIRKSAFLMAMRDAGLWDFGQPEPCVKYPYPVEYQKDGRPANYEGKAAQLFVDYYRENPEIDVVFCGNDELITQISKIIPLSELPQMIGFDNSIWSQENQVSSIGADMNNIVNEILNLLSTPKTEGYRITGIPAMLYKRGTDW